MVGRGVVGPFDGDLDDYQRYLLDESKRLREQAKLEDQGQAALVAAPTRVAATPQPSTATVAVPTSAAASPSAAPAAPPTPVAPAPRDGREQRKLDAQARQQAAEKTRPLKKELEQIDKRLAVLSAERAALEQKLAEPLPPAEIAECGRRLKAGHEETAQLEERWMEISSLLEDRSVANAH